MSKGKDVFIAGLGCVHVVPVEKGESTMRIEIEAKLILTVPEPKAEESPEDIILAAEQHINDVAAVFTRLGTKTKVGVRIHTKDFKTLE